MSDLDNHNYFTPVSDLSTNNIEVFSTGSSKLDKILGGGIETDEVTQIYGPPGSGKTQICFTICSLLPKHLKSIYLDTEVKFRVERIKQITEVRNIDSSAILKNIILSKVINHNTLEKIINKMPEMIDSNPSIKIVIVDSIMNHLRVEYPGRSQLPERQQKLNILLNKLQKIAARKVAVIITNHIHTKPDNYFGNTDIPIGGNIISYNCNKIIQLKKASFTMCAKLVKSSYLPFNESVFVINEKGVDDEQT